MNITNFIPTYLIRRRDSFSQAIYRQNYLPRLGTDYGGWHIPELFINHRSICYSVGAGEDISFDVELVNRYTCNVYIFDPTPAAIKHFEKLKKAVKNNQKMMINNKRGKFYDLDIKNLPKLKFNRIGIWDKKGYIKFFAPSNPKHTSHSIVNLQKTKKYFKARVNSIKNIMKENNHLKLDLLKLDIEGAEYKAIASLIEDNIKPSILCVEFDEVNNPLDNNYQKRIKKYVNALLNCGYIIIYTNNNGVYTFMKNGLVNNVKIFLNNLINSK